MSRPLVNPFLNEDRPPADHELTLHLGRRACVVQEIWVSLLERALDPAWVWAGPGWGWALQALIPGVAPLAVREQDRSLEGVVSFPVEVLDALHRDPLLSTRARHRVPMVAKGADDVYAYVDLDAHDGVDVLLELVDARARHVARSGGSRLPV